MTWSAEDEAFAINWGGPPTKAQWEWLRAADEVGDRYSAAMREARRVYMNARAGLDNERGYWEKKIFGRPPASRYQLIQAEREIAELRAQVKYREELRALRDPDTK